MIKRVERFEAKFERLAFRQFSEFVKRHVKVIYSRSVERPTGRISLSPERIRTEQRSVEVWLSVSRVVVDFEIPRSDVGQIDAHRVDAVVLRVDEEVVAIAGEGHGQPCREPSDSRYCPAFGQAIPHTK